MYKITININVPPHPSGIININKSIEYIVTKSLTEEFENIRVEEVGVFQDNSGQENIIFSMYIPYSNGDKAEDLVIADLSLAVEERVSIALLELFETIDVKDAVISTVVNAEVVDLPNVSIQINEEPLTVQNLATILSTLTDLYTKCWLMVQNRFAELIEYTQTRNNRFSKEANLVVAKLSYNSPAEIKLETGFSPKDFGEGLKAAMEALKIGIDALAQTPLRFQNATLENQLKEAETKLKELETKSTLADQEQSRQIAAQKAERDYQLFLLERERQRLELLEKRLEVEKKRIEYAIEIANKIVSVTNPDIHPEVRNMLIQTLLPNILQLGSSNGLELAPGTSLSKDN